MQPAKLHLVGVITVEAGPLGCRLPCCWPAGGGRRKRASDHVWYTPCWTCAQPRRREAGFSKHSRAMSNERDPDSMDTGTPEAPSESLTDALSTQARLAREERSAALRALAGRLAHQIRNPLAAVRAACSSLRHELEDADQRETLDLTLREIDRMLGFVKATVQTIPDRNETPRAVDLAAETAAVVDVVQSGGITGFPIRLATAGKPWCSAPRNGLRAAVFSLLDHFADVAEVAAVDVSVQDNGERAQLRFAVHGSATDGAAAPGGWSQPIGLLVAERFARDAGGLLRRSDDGGGRHTFTLDLPRADV